MKPKEFEKLSKQQQNLNSCNIASPCPYHRPTVKISAGKQSSFAIKGEWCISWDQHLICSLVWSFCLLMLWINFQKSSDFSVWHAVKSATLAAFWFLPVRQGNQVILCTERMMVSVRWVTISWEENTENRKNSWDLSGGAFPDVTATALHNYSPEVWNRDHVLWGVEPFPTQGSQWTKDNFCITSQWSNSILQAKRSQGNCICSLTCCLIIFVAVAPYSLEKQPVLELTC